MTAKVNPETDVDGSSAIETDTDEQIYRCPHCEATYAEELLTRVHITRADDSNHRHRNGSMPEEEIEVIAEDGTIVDTRSRRPEDIDLSDVMLDDFPSDISKKQRHALVVATRHPEIDNRSELTELVVDRLETGDWDTSPPSYQTVRRALDGFYNPHDSTNNVQDPDDETLADLTPVQQSIIIARVMLSEEANTAIADRIGCASSYPGQISSRKEHILTELRSRIEKEDIETILADELPANACTALIENGYLSEIPLNVQLLEAKMDIDDSSESEPVVAIEEDTASDISSDSQWGSPVKNTNGMHAAPETPFGPADHVESDSTDGQPTDGNSGVGDSPNVVGTRSDTDPGPVSDDNNRAETTTDSESNSDDTADSSHDVDASSSAIISEITSLQEKVEFFRATLGPITKTNEQMVLLDSFADQIEQSCETMLKAHDGS